VLSSVFDVCVGVAVDVGVDVGVGVGVGVGLGVALTLDEEALDPEELELESPALKISILADPPGGTVTTQKFALPAPEDWSELDTPPTPLTEGSIEQGRPLHPEPEHVILTPKVGVVCAQSQSM
jgi:hypothetical protein